MMPSIRKSWQRNELPERKPRGPYLQVYRYGSAGIFLPGQTGAPTGDAAHVHSPAGGQGLNIGVQDAVNLGWKLANVVHGISPDTLLDTYHTERHPVGARLLRNTMALGAIERSDDRIGALRDMISELIQTDGPRLAMMSGLDVHYDFGEGHLLLGRRMPDLDLITAEGPLRVSTLLHDGRPVLLNFGAPDGIDVAQWEAVSS